MDKKNQKGWTKLLFIIDFHFPIFNFSPKSSNILNLLKYVYNVIDTCLQSWDPMRSPSFLESSYCWDSQLVSTAVTNLDINICHKSFSFFILLFNLVSLIDLLSHNHKILFSFSLYYHILYPPNITFMPPLLLVLPLLLIYTAIELNSLLWL